LFFIGGFQIGLRRVGDWIVLLIIVEVAVQIGIDHSQAAAYPIGLAGSGSISEAKFQIGSL
jgi:hypothetical protein